MVFKQLWHEFGNFFNKCFGSDGGGGNIGLGTICWAVLHVIDEDGDGVFADKCEGNAAEEDGKGFGETGGLVETFQEFLLHNHIIFKDIIFKGVNNHK